MQTAAMPSTHAVPSAGAAARAGRMSVWVFIAWLGTYVVEGPLRGGLYSIGLPNLLYARDLVAAAGIAAAFALPLVRGQRPAPGLVLMAWLLAVHVCIGLLLGGTLFQRLFGVKIFLPLLYTCLLYTSPSPRD